MDKYINLKPNLKKVIGSILLAIVSLILFRIFYDLVFCRSIVGCITTMMCDYPGLFSCCHSCVSPFIFFLQIFLGLILPLLIIYIIWSLLQKKK